MPCEACCAAWERLLSVGSLPSNVLSASLALVALEPAPVTPILTRWQAPPATVTKAATPTMAKWEALLANFL